MKFTSVGKLIILITVVGILILVPLVKTFLFIRIATNNLQNSNELAYSVSSSLSYTINGNTISRYTSNDNVKEHLNQKLVSREAITTINNINDFSLSYEAFIKKSHDDITVKVLSTSDLIDSELIKNARDQSKISDLLDMKKYSIETYPTLSEMQNFFDRAKIYHNPASTRLKYIFTFDSSEENNLPQIVTNLDPSKILTYEANVYLSEKLKIENIYLKIEWIDNYNEGIFTLNTQYSNLIF